MSLCESEQNSTYRIKQMNFELDETGAGKRLEALGLKKGTIVTVISKKKQGGVKHGRKNDFFSGYERLHSANRS